MRKLTLQNIRYLKRHSKKQFRNRIKRIDKKYNFVENIISNNYFPKTKGSRTNKIHFTDINAPIKFNLKYENCNEFISFVHKLKKLGHDRKNINVLMDNVTEIGEGAIAMLLSVLDELTKLKILIKGTKPSTEIERDILEKSGFFKYINGSIEYKNRNTKNTILRTGGVSYTHLNLSEEIRNANETVWGEKGRNPPLRGTIFEMMRNSCDHAFKKGKIIIWHFGISHVEDSNLVKFSFVDNGRGIIKSFTEGFLSRVLNFFSDNADILETAFKDGIESRTGLSWRGKGLPTIYENYKDGYIKNLVVISNDVYIDFDNEIYMKLEIPFSGTYYYWILNNECTKACYV